MKKTTQLQQSSAGMGDMQDKLKELEEKYKDQPDVLAKETMKMMKTGATAPLKWCMSMLIQLPIMIGLYRVIMDFSQQHITQTDIYSFLNMIAPNVIKYLDVANVSPYFFGLNLFDKNSIILAVIVWVLMFLQTRLTMLMQSKNPKPQPTMAPGGQQLPDMQKMMGPMNIFMVFMMVSIVYTIQNGVWLYLAITTLVSVIQYTIQNKELIRISWLTRGVDKKKLTNK